jgi:hypothetical protein
MKNRFQPDRRTSWRQRFLAIAREFEAGSRRRESLDAPHANRQRLGSSPRLLRGIRLGCIRPA